MLRSTRIAKASFIAAASLLGLVLQRHLARVDVGLGGDSGWGTPGAGGGDARSTSELLNRGRFWGSGRGWQAGA
jgi:hypothetical protein